MKTSVIIGRLMDEADLLDTFGPTQMGEVLRAAAAFIIQHENCDRERESVALQAELLKSTCAETLQALGDARALKERNYPVSRLHFRNRKIAIAQLIELANRL